MPDVDLRSGFQAVRDQGRRGTCVAFAVTAGHEHARFNTTALTKDLSEEALYYQCKQIDGDTTSGTSFDSAVEALDMVGQPLAAKWPYNKRLDDTAADYLPPLEAIDPQFCYKADLITIPSDINEIVNCLGLGHSVVIGIPLYSSFQRATGGRIPLPSLADTLVGHHALLLVGYETDPSNTKWLIFRNSWGAGWGDMGYGYLLFDYIGTYGCQAFIVRPK
jgi:C1A family cysteine protease